MHICFCNYVCRWVNEMIDGSLRWNPPEVCLYLQLLFRAKTEPFSLYSVRAHQPARDMFFHVDIISGRGDIDCCSTPERTFSSQTVHLVFLPLSWLRFGCFCTGSLHQNITAVNPKATMPDCISQGDRCVFTHSHNLSSLIIMHIYLFYLYLMSYLNKETK